MLTVKVANFPGQTKEIVVPEGTTVEECFRFAEITPNGTNITRNGLAASMSDLVQNGDRVIAAQAAKGNA